MTRVRVALERGWPAYAERQVALFEAAIRGARQSLMHALALAIQNTKTAELARLYSFRRVLNAGPPLTTRSLLILDDLIAAAERVQSEAEADLLSMREGMLSEGA